MAASCLHGRCVTHASQAGPASLIVSVTTLFEQLVLHGLAEHENALADHLIAVGLEDYVPIKDVVKYLKQAGVPSAGALRLKAGLVAAMPPVRSPRVSQCT